ncbi:hypothetical protein M231_06432 [Tremella mesenterica]|uniref:Uncharacterized protein n=1 Tax=Tremella mesenterica TaxID=5217 RepID=A0A4Q1BDW7_TREME|nr:hypothetical protein M231_06432 [Tremella mesenterica]
MSILNTLDSYVRSLAQPIHPYFPIAPLDIFGAMRLSSVVDWYARGVFDDHLNDGEKTIQSSKRKQNSRASLLQELTGIMVIVFGGETFLGLCTGTPPSWLLSPKIPLLFSLIHILQTRTPLRRLLPPTPSLTWELPIAIPDAISRTLLLTRFSIVPLLHSHPLPATPTTLLLVPFILAVPFAAIIFTGLNFFSPTPTWTAPVELRPIGWMIMDMWGAILIPTIFLCLIGPVQGWNYGLGMREDEGTIVCMMLLATLGIARALVNLGPSKEAWRSMLGSSYTRTKTEILKSKKEL